MNRKGTIILSSCFALSVFATIAMTAPVRTDYEATVYPLFADTIPGRFTGDSALYSAAIPVMGARVIIVEASNSGGSATNDTLSVGEPIFDVTGTGTYNTYPPGGIQRYMQGVESAASGVVVPAGTQIYKFYSSTQGGSGGTPIPVTTRSIKFKIKSGNTRKFSGATNTNLTTVGTITVRAIIFR